ncbi:MAG: hypothetical protein GY795_04815, partial [Desulfobacterales bacterium]|nr:hypothetical protein [Desulfobacterales bacterium]
NKWPRMMADVDKDGAADIVAFGSSGVWVSIADPDNPIINKRFKERQRWTEWFGSDANIGGWDDNNKWPRMMADVDKDGAADIVAFGSSGVWVSIADPDNPIINEKFELRKKWIAHFGSDSSSGYWYDNKTWPRMMADIDKDKKSDIVAFGQAGVYVLRSTGNGFY